METNKNFNNGVEYIKIFRETAANEKKSDKSGVGYIRLFLIQTLVSIIILGAVVVAKYASPNTFISMSSALDGLYQNNVTLSDLSDLINDRVLSNDAVAVFFNTSGRNAD